MTDTVDLSRIKVFEPEAGIISSKRYRYDIACSCFFLKFESSTRDEVGADIVIGEVLEYISDGELMATIKGQEERS